MQDLPAEPYGTGQQVNWLRRLRGFVQSLVVLPGVGYRVKSRTAQGTILEIMPQAGGGSGATVERYRVESVGGDYIICHTWDGSSEGTDSVYIAKPYKLRHSITSATVDGTAVTYSYTTLASNLDKMRTATNGAITEDQKVTPRWLTDDEIFAMAADNGVTYTTVTGTDTETATCSLLDLNVDARMWAAYF